MSDRSRTQSQVATHQSISPDPNEDSIASSASARRRLGSQASRQPDARPRRRRAADARSSERGRTVRVRPCVVRLIGPCSRSRRGLTASPAASLGTSSRLEDAAADYTRRHRSAMPSALATHAEIPARGLEPHESELGTEALDRDSHVGRRVQGANTENGARCPRFDMPAGRLA